MYEVRNFLSYLRTMSKQKNLQQILDKLSITELNEMQEQSKLAIHSHENVLILSPTGSGKTLAFLLPIVAEIDRNQAQVQALIITPSRELAIQIEQVAREMGAGLKINAAYGGQRMAKDKMNLQHPPHILIGTPGRIADHLRRQTFSTDLISTIILDEFDKSLEIGFEDEMSEIFILLKDLNKRILTSATQGIDIPEFIGFENPLVVDFLNQKVKDLTLKKIVSPEKDKLDTLVNALQHLQGKTGIVFANFKDSISRISSYLNVKGIKHGIFYGGLEQQERERALIKFRNGTHQVLLATDLAARGLDISEIHYIIHYHLPLRSEEFTHRNGRTARMHKEGAAYVLLWKNEKTPDFIPNLEEEILSEPSKVMKSKWETLFISGGRKDKISKGDIAGFLYKTGKLERHDVGEIELKNDCAFVAVNSSKVTNIIKRLNNQKLKGRKLRIYKI